MEKEAEEGRFEKEAEEGRWRRAAKVLPPVLPKQKG